MKTANKVRQSTSKPSLNEMRKIDGIVKIWNGVIWVTDNGQFYEPLCGKCQALTIAKGFEDKCDEHAEGY